MPTQPVSLCAAPNGLGELCVFVVVVFKHTHTHTSHTAHCRVKCDYNNATGAAPQAIINCPFGREDDNNQSRIWPINIQSAGRPLRRIPRLAFARSLKCTGETKNTARRLSTSAARFRINSIQLIDVIAAVGTKRSYYKQYLQC